VVRNTLTKRDIQDAFEKWHKRLKWCIRAEKDYFEDAGGR
jgi:hypothetical protein